VVLADDQTLFLQGLALLLQAEPDIQVVAQAGDGAAAVAASAALHPNVAVLDVRMPVMDGVEATREIVRDGSGSPPGVLVLTTYDADDVLFAALQAGASGFVLKDLAPAELAAAIRAIARGDGWLAPQVTKAVLRQFTQRPFGATVGDPRLDQLTGREIDILQLIAEGMSNAEMGARLYLAEGTVKTHVSHLLNKLGLRDRAQLTVFAFMTGSTRD
jgi:DNA-binding NarL/FixJ family response regulator